jgi:colicin import membrane protein
MRHSKGIAYIERLQKARQRKQEDEEWKQHKKFLADTKRLQQKQQAETKKKLQEQKDQAKKKLQEQKDQAKKTKKRPSAAGQHKKEDQAKKTKKKLQKGNFEKAFSDAAYEYEERRLCFENETSSENESAFE